MTETEHVPKIGLLAYRLSTYVKLHRGTASSKIGRVKTPAVKLSIYMMRVKKLWVASHVLSLWKVSDGGVLSAGWPKNVIAERLVLCVCALSSSACEKFTLNWRITNAT